MSAWQERPDFGPRHVFVHRPEEDPDFREPRVIRLPRKRREPEPGWTWGPLVWGVTAGIGFGYVVATAIVRAL